MSVLVEFTKPLEKTNGLIFKKKDVSLDFDKGPMVSYKTNILKYGYIFSPSVDNTGTRTKKNGFLISVYAIILACRNHHKSISGVEIVREPNHNVILSIYFDDGTPQAIMKELVDQLRVKIMVRPDLTFASRNKGLKAYI